MNRDAASAGMSEREQEIFCNALECANDAERNAFLDTACAGSPELRARVDALLRAAGDAADFLEEDEAPVTEAPGSRIGPYRLGECIGEGGFGVVYRAEQEEPVRRTVALKIIKLGMDTRAVVARFEAERQALAMMDHPHIARVFDGGATAAGRPYFVMEMVDGVPITTYGNEHRLSLRERLDLFLDVCRAVHHAHQKGIIHRDLKPSNILVTQHDGRPVVKVIDFGIAKAIDEPLTEKTLLTRLHVFMGTPAYMSPEQVALGSGDIDTRADIFSLGALLYELLADALPIDPRTLAASDYAGIQRMIHHVDPPSPSQRVVALDPEVRRAVALKRGSTVPWLVNELRGDLDRIVLKCLEKDRVRRYETTEDLMQDIMRYLRDEPVLARPATLGYRATKFVRRHQRSVTATVIAVSLAIGFGIYHAYRLAAERDRAQLEARKAEKMSEMLTQILTSTDPYRTPTQEGVLSASAAKVRLEFASQPEVQAELLNAIGRVYLRRGEQAQARVVLTEALSAGRSIGRPDLRLAQALSNMGVLHTDLGDNAGAISFLEEALAIRRQLLGDSNEVAISLVELGRAHNSLEQLDRSEALLREALAMRVHVLGEVHRETAVSYGDVAVVLWLKGDFAGAEPLFQQSIALHKKTVGAEHPNVGQSYVNLAQLRIDQGDLRGAESLLRDAVTIFERGFGERHWRVARLRGTLADVWRRQGRFAEAAKALDDALATVREALGPDRPQVAQLAIERARVDLDQHNGARAVPLLREAMRTLKNTYVTDGWRLATVKTLLGQALVQAGERAEGETLLREANDRLKEIPGPQGRETRATREALAALDPR